MSGGRFGAELQVLNPGIGYGILAGIGAVFTLVMIGTTWFQNRDSAYSTKQSEEFNTASRSVKPGLIVAGIVSSWTWSATLLTSSTFAYAYGISGPMWCKLVDNNPKITRRGNANLKAAQTLLSVLPRSYCSRCCP